MIREAVPEKVRFQHSSGKCSSVCLARLPYSPHNRNLNLINYHLQNRRDSDIISPVSRLSQTVDPQSRPKGQLVSHRPLESFTTHHLGQQAQVRDSHDVWGEDVARARPQVQCQTHSYPDLFPSWSGTQTQLHICLQIIVPVGRRDHNRRQESPRAPLRFRTV